MHLLEYVALEWNELSGWIETIVQHHRAGTLPKAGVTATLSPRDPVHPDDKTDPLGTVIPQAAPRVITVDPVEVPFTTPVSELPVEPVVEPAVEPEAVITESTPAAAGA